MTTQKTSSKTLDILTAVAIFFIVFGLWQLFYLTLEYITLEPFLYDILYLSFPGISLCIYVLIIKLRHTTFRRHGYRKPTTISTKTTIKLSLIFVAVFIIMILAPGLTAFSATGSISEGFELSPFLNTPLRIAYRILYGIAYAVLLSIMYESIFRGYVFRNLVRHLGFFTSLYAASIMFSLASSAGKMPIKYLLSMSAGGLVEFVFMEILTAFAAGLFLGFFFYKIGWSLLGPVAFQLGVTFFIWPDPLIISTSLWWMALTFQVVGYAVLILAVDTFIKEPMYRRRKYGLES